MNDESKEAPSNELRCDYLVVGAGAAGASVNTSRRKLLGKQPVHFEREIFQIAITTLCGLT